MFSWTSKNDVIHISSKPSCYTPQCDVIINAPLSSITFVITYFYLIFGICFVILYFLAKYKFGYACLVIGVVQFSNVQGIEHGLFMYPRMSTFIQQICPFLCSTLLATVRQPTDLQLLAFLVFGAQILTLRFFIQICKCIM